MKIFIYALYALGASLLMQILCAEDAQEKLTIFISPKQLDKYQEKIARMIAHTDSDASDAGAGSGAGNADGGPGVANYTDT